ncbi:MAG: hypothetical protein DWQ05_16760 [Calditrichaeota bacterium]|nr:MAG: hypothetical protein DWQ05_16760 [Calditrichota bacterium]
MKKMFFHFFLFLFSIPVLAQVPLSKGTYTLSGEFNYTSSSERRSSFTTKRTHLSPNIGYFFFDKLHAELALLYDKVTREGILLKSYAMGPEFRYYFSDKKIAPFLGIGYAFKIDNLSDSFLMELDSRSSALTLGGGLIMFITKRFAIESSLNYRMSTMKMETASSLFGDFDYEENSRTTQFLLGVNYFIYREVKAR